MRKALGKHEIATVQAMSIDREAGLVRLTTMLTHSSGEWVSSEWPVCPVNDTAVPHKMGAALTGRNRQTSLRALGIEIAFSREGRGGTRIIRISTSHENPRHKTVSTVTVIDQVPSKSAHAARQTVGTVSAVSDPGSSKSGNPAPREGTTSR